MEGRAFGADVVGRTLYAFLPAPQEKKVYRIHAATYTALLAWSKVPQLPWFRWASIHQGSQPGKREQNYVTELAV